MIENTLPNIDMAKTGAMIKRLREERGISVKELQGYLGFTSPQAIYKWQWGKTLPDIANLLALSDLFKVKMEDLLVYDQREDMSERDFYHYRHRLKGGDHLFDKKTMEMINEIFSALKILGDKPIYRLWLRFDFDQKEWIELSVSDQTSDTERMIYLDDTLIYKDKMFDDGNAIDAYRFFKMIKEAVLKTITIIQNGGYASFLKDLPYTRRYGVIKGEDLNKIYRAKSYRGLYGIVPFDILPIYRTLLFKDIKVDHFISLPFASDQADKIIPYIDWIDIFKNL